MSMLQELSSALNVHKKEMIVPMVDSQFFYVEAEQTKGFLDQTMEMQEADMKFFNVKQSQPYSNSLDKATIVNNSNATITQQETFTKTTTDSFTFTNTRGFTKGGSINATIGTPFLGGVGTTLNLSFNVSSTASTAKTVAQARSQQQTITVPANTSLEATWIIKNVDIDAEYVMELEAGPKPAIKAGLIAGKMVVADQPVAPVYRYVHEKGDKYLYYTSSTVQIENYHLDTITPLFFVNSQAMSQALMPMGGAHRHMKNFQIALKQVGKGKEMSLVPIFPTGASQPSATSAQDPMLSQVAFQANIQYVPGTIALWRYRKDGLEPSFRLEVMTSPENIPGWVNEGFVAFVFPTIPGMKEVTSSSGHAHPLNQVQLDKEKDLKHKREKCAKCWRKIDQTEPYYRCEQCKTFIQCDDCYSASDHSAEKVVEDAVGKFYEIFEALDSNRKTFKITGKMHGTQGTHTFINLNTLDAKSAAGSQKATEDALIQETTKEKEKEKESTKKSKKYIEEMQVKFKKQYLEEDSSEKSSSIEKKVEAFRPVQRGKPAAPAELPNVSTLTIAEALPPPPPPLDPAMLGAIPAAFNNPYPISYCVHPIQLDFERYYTTPLQSFINNPSTVQPYFTAPPAPPPPPAPVMAAPLPTTTRTIQTPLPPTTSAPSNPRPPLHRSVEELYSIPLHQYSHSNSPHLTKPSYARQEMDQQGKFTTIYEDSNQQSSNLPAYQYQQYPQQHYEQPQYNQYDQYNQQYNQPHYNQQYSQYEQQYSQQYAPPDQQSFHYNGATPYTTEYSYPTYMQSTPSNIESGGETKKWWRRNSKP